MAQCVDVSTITSSYDCLVNCSTTLSIDTKSKRWHDYYSHGVSVSLLCFKKHSKKKQPQCCYHFPNWIFLLKYSPNCLHHVSRQKLSCYGIMNVVIFWNRGKYFWKVIVGNTPGDIYKLSIVMVILDDLYNTPGEIYKLSRIAITISQSTRWY